MAKLTELPSDDDTPPSLSNKHPNYAEQKPPTTRMKSEKTVQKDRKNANTLYINYILLPIIMVITSIIFLYVSQNGRVVNVKSSQAKKGILFTGSELSKHDGSDPNIPVYIAILGRVYDVDKGRKHYGKDSGYNVFAGRDSTPSFVTGQFSRDKATDDVTGLSPEEMLGIKGWMDFYRKDYTYIGKLIGRYYDKDGKPTPALKKAKELIKEGQQLKEKQKDEDKKFPPCNSKWSQNEGSEVWCSTQSGGIHRSWIGVPRQFFNPGSRQPKCVCVRTNGPSSDTLEGNEGDLNNAHLKLYPGCKKMDVSCKLRS